MKIIGHRGARGLAPENTIASVREALEAGVDGIEIDVRITKDSQPVLLHDPFIVDEKGARYLLAKHTLTELRQIKPDLTLLRDAITLVNRRVPVMIEVKRGEQTQPIIAVIKDFLAKEWRPSDFMVASFSQKTLTALHHSLPEVTPIVIAHFSGLHAAWRARRLGTKHISMSRYVLWSGYIRAAHHAGYHLYTFTLNDPAKAAKWQKYGLESVITDRPDQFLVKE